MSSNLIAVYPEGLTEEGRETLKTLDCEFMIVSLEDTKHFALNSMVLGNDVVVHYEAVGFIE